MTDREKEFSDKLDKAFSEGYGVDGVNSIEDAKRHTKQEVFEWCDGRFNKLRVTTMTFMSEIS